MEITNINQEDNIIFHYTTMDTLYSLLERYRENQTNNNLVFWASSIIAMNDPKEMKNGLEVLEYLMPVIEQFNNIIPENKLDIPSLDFNKVLKDSSYNSFVLSFTKNNDDLSMWAMYGDNGCGVALIFDLDVKTKLIDTSQQSRLIQVNYKKSITDYQKLVQIYNKGSIHWIQCDDNDKKKEYKEQTLSQLLIQLCPYIKSAAYEKENEYRYCFHEIPNDNVCFRIKNKNIIPYMRALKKSL